MKQDAPFFVGATNIYDYQRKGYRRFNTMTADQVQAQTGMGAIQAQCHVAQRERLSALHCTLCGGTWHLAKDCRWAK